MLEESIVLDLGIDEPGMPLLCGLLLTQDERFIAFELETDALHREVLQIEEWADVSGLHNVNQHNRGVGIGSGALAIKVLRELCASASI